MLTENQKNYIALLLIGGPLPEDELRMFLARSGWDINSIDAGVVYSKTVELENLVRAAQSESTPQATVTAATAATQPTTVLGIENSPTTEKSQAFEQVIPQTKATVLDPGVIEKSSPELENHLSSIEGLSAYHSSAISSQTLDTKTSTRAMMSDITPVMTMPSQVAATQNTSAPATKSKALSVIIWLLAIIFILATLAVLGYMFYTGTGPFQNISYIKA